MNKPQPVFEKLLTKPRLLFLIDGVGALISTFFLAVILTAFEERIGMPEDTLHWLAAGAFVLAIYSLTCALLARRHWRILFLIVGLANVFYCCVTVMLMLHHYATVTALGFAYFIAEITIVIILVRIEFRASNHYRQKN